MIRIKKPLCIHVHTGFLHAYITRRCLVFVKGGSTFLIIIHLYHYYGTNTQFALQLKFIEMDEHELK